MSKKKCEHKHMFKSNTSDVYYCHDCSSYFKEKTTFERYRKPVHIMLILNFAYTLFVLLLLNLRDFIISIEKTEEIIFLNIIGFPVIFIFLSMIYIILYTLFCWKFDKIYVKCERPT